MEGGGHSSPVRSTGDCPDCTGSLPRKTMAPGGTVACDGHQSIPKDGGEEGPRSLALLATQVSPEVTMTL